jgi:hypothetical protein
MVWARMLAYITGTVDQELLVRNEYLAAENALNLADCPAKLLILQPDRIVTRDRSDRAPSSSTRSTSQCSWPSWCCEN